MTALAGLALLTACSGSSNPRVLPTLTPTPTATQAVLSVTVPGAARAATPSGAAAFVKFYFASLNEAYRKGVQFPVGDLSASTCKSCANFARVADQLVRRNHHFVGDTFTKIDAEAPPIERGQCYVTLTASLPAREEADASGHVVKHIPAEANLALTVVTVRTANSWSVSAMTSS